MSGPCVERISDRGFLVIGEVRACPSTPQHRMVSGMQQGGRVYPDGSGDRRGFPRLSITERIKLEAVDNPQGSPATFGSTIDISRGGLEAVIQGTPIPVGSRCIVRFLSTTRIEPVMAWGVVVGVEKSAAGRIIRVEFETPLESLRLTPKVLEQESGNATVLVVDDDENIRDVLERFLTEKGYSVQSAHDGQLGLDALRNKLPNVLLLDLYLPKLNGLQILEIMQQEGLKPAVVLTISGEADDESARRSMQLGAHDFLVKPLDLSYLDWAIRLRL